MMGGEAFRTIRSNEAAGPDETAVAQLTHKMVPAIARTTFEELKREGASPHAFNAATAALIVVCADIGAIAASLSDMTEGDVDRMLDVMCGALRTNMVVALQDRIAMRRGGWSSDVCQ